MTTKEKIIQLYKPLNLTEKREFRMSLSKKLNKEPTTLINWWFSKAKGYAVPEEYREKVLNELIILHHKKGTLSLYTEKQEV